MIQWKTNPFGESSASRKETQLFFCPNYLLKHQGKMVSKSLVVVRGNFRGLDPTYACLSHDGNEGNYGLIHFNDGRLTKREVIPHSQRSTVEDFTLRNNYRGSVYVDDRTCKNLLPLKTGKHCLPFDLGKFRRAKSDVEIDSLNALYGATRELLHNDDLTDRKFRGAATMYCEETKAAFKRTECKGFVQYRGGLKDSLGRVADLTRVEPKTQQWVERLDRVYRGLSMVRQNVNVGASLKRLNNDFMGYMDPTMDVVYGNVIHHTGFEGHEADIPLDTINEYDFLKLGVAIGDAKSGDVALVYRSAFPVILTRQEKLEKFKGTHIEHSTRDVANQLQMHHDQLTDIINETFSANDNEIQDMIYKGICDPSSYGKTFQSVVSELASHYRSSLKQSSSQECDIDTRESIREKLYGGDTTTPAMSNEDIHNSLRL
jgi:hypothetical protein